MPSRLFTPLPALGVVPVVIWCILKAVKCTHHGLTWVFQRLDCTEHCFMCLPIVFSQLSLAQVIHSLIDFQKLVDTSNILYVLVLCPLYVLRIFCLVYSCFIKKKLRIFLRCFGFITKMREFYRISCIFLVCICAEPPSLTTMPSRGVFVKICEHMGMSPFTWKPQSVSVFTCGDIHCASLHKCVVACACPKTYVHALSMSPF